MDGYTVVTSDGDKIGTVVGEEAGNLIVQTGTLRHHTHAIPKTFVHPDDDDRTVRSMRMLPHVVTGWYGIRLTIREIEP